MPGYINCGATDERGQFFKTKAALKRALAEDPSKVTFYGTAQALGPELGGAGTIDGNHVPEGVTLVVVGPDPKRQRNWYGNVKIVKGVTKVT
jgi:ABC-type histidine transport system ATPase subunit